MVGCDEGLAQQPMICSTQAMHLSTANLHNNIAALPARGPASLVNNNNRSNNNACQHRWAGA